MPKFDPRERETIRRTLETAGERLFVAMGLKKVTIEDLTSSAGIAKASFYSFFVNKEELFLYIVMRRQEEIFLAMETLLENNRHMDDRYRVREVFVAMAQKQAAYPILQQITPDIVRILELRVPQDKLVTFRQSNLQAVLRMQNHGIHFTCDAPVVSGVFLALYGCWLQMMSQDPAWAFAVVDILLDGALDRVIAGSGAAVKAAIGVTAAGVL